MSGGNSNKYDVEIKKHLDWLRSFDVRYTTKWEMLLENDAEAAICEAMTRDLLECHKIEIKPYENLSIGGPDFLCCKDEKHFYVEVTCLKRDTVTQKSHAPEEPLTGHYAFLITKALLQKLVGKVKQCSNLKHPCVIAIGTEHRRGYHYLGNYAAKALLTGTPKITGEIDLEQGKTTTGPYLSTDLKDSAFIYYEKNSLGHLECKRNPISAVLLCDFGSDPVKVVGALHPNPNRVFDRILLPKIKFCRLVEGCIQATQLKVEWI